MAKVEEEPLIDDGCKLIREIDTIFGGIYVGRETRNAQRSYAREAKDSLIMSFIVNMSVRTIHIVTP